MLLMKLFLQDVIRFDQQINYASSASAWTDLSFSDHFAVSWAGAVAAVQQCDFEGIFLSNVCLFVFGICLKIVRFHHHHPSGTLHLPGWRKLSVFPSSCSYVALEPWRMLACRCGLCCRKNSFELPWNDICEGGSGGWCTAADRKGLGVSISSLRSQNSNCILGAGARLSLLWVSCFAVLRLSGSQLHSWRVEFWGSPQKNMNLLEVQFHKIVEFFKKNVCMYIYIVTIELYITIHHKASDS